MRKTEPVLASDQRMVRVTHYGPDYAEMGDNPELCERRCGLAYDRALFKECPKCAALRRAEARERDEQIKRALIVATEGHPQH